jgi:hypothetical protein
MFYSFRHIVTGDNLEEIKEKMFSFIYILCRFSKINGEDDLTIFNCSKNILLLKI